MFIKTIEKRVRERKADIVERWNYRDINRGSEDAPRTDTDLLRKKVRVPYATKASLDASGAPGFTESGLASVWDDDGNNGNYYWDIVSKSWLLSPATAAPSNTKIEVLSIVTKNTLPPTIFNQVGGTAKLDVNGVVYPEHAGFFGTPGGKELNWVANVIGYTLEPSDFVTVTYEATS